MSVYLYSNGIKGNQGTDLGLILQGPSLCAPRTHLISHPPIPTEGLFLSQAADKGSGFFQCSQPGTIEKIAPQGIPRLIQFPDALVQQRSDGDHADQYLLGMAQYL